MGFAQVIRELQAAGLSENAIVAALRDRNTPCSQATINKLKHGGIADPRYTLGAALIELHQERVGGRRPPS